MDRTTYSFQNPPNVCYQKRDYGCKGKTFFIYPKLAPVKMIYFFRNNINILKQLHLLDQSLYTQSM